jgi:RNA polymerase sigma-70 factor (ECF subfamily)
MRTAHSLRDMRDATRLTRFKALLDTHLNAAYNLARWLTRDEFGAEEAVQEACTRAWRAWHAFDDGPENGKAWFMAIVRHCAFDWLRGSKARALEEDYDEEAHNGAGTDTPETLLLRANEATRVRLAIARLPAEYREVIVLRELEDLAYKDIGAITGVPIGTVMSRLSRARDLLRERLAEPRARKLSS